MNLQNKNNPNSTQSKFVTCIATIILFTLMFMLMAAFKESSFSISEWSSKTKFYVNAGILIVTVWTILFITKDNDNNNPQGT